MKNNRVMLLLLYFRESKGVHFCSYSNIQNIIEKNSSNTEVDSLNAILSISYHLLKIFQDIYKNDIEGIKK